MKPTDYYPKIVDQGEINLRDVVVLLWKNKAIIALCSVGTATIAAVVSLFFLVPQFESTAVIMDASDNRKASGFRGFGENSPFSAFLSFGGAGQTMIQFNEILSSRRTVASIVDEQQLLRRLKIEVDSGVPLAGERAREQLINDLKAVTVITFDRDVLRLQVRHSDPVFAKEMVGWYLETLKEFIRSNLMTQARATEIFILERLQDMERELRETEVEYIALKKEQGVVELPSQIKFSLETASQLRAQIIEIDMQIELYKDIIRDSSEVIRLEQEKKQLEAQLLRLVDGVGVTSNDSRKLANIFTPLGESSALEFEFASAERNYLTQVNLVELLRQQLEMARIESKKAEPVFQIIDEPVVGVFPVSPNKKLNTVLGFLLGFTLSTAIVLFLNQFSALPKTITRIVKLDVKDSPVNKKSQLS